MRRFGPGFLGFCLALAAVPAAASPPFVFPVFNQGALARQHALPSPEAASAEAGWHLQLDWTNEVLLEQAGTESLRLDSESLRLSISEHWRWAGWRFTAELPLLITGGGVLDSGIEEWHGWFGLPNGGREQLPRDAFRNTYTRGADTIFDVGDSGSRLGDLRLGAATCGEALRCLRVMLQLPTGDADELEGGGLGAAGWYEQGFRLGVTERWSGAMAAGVSATRGDGPLQDLMETLVPFGWLSLAYALTERLDAGVQFYAHGPLYDDSALEALTRTGLQLAFGFRYALDESTFWTLGLQEDLITRSSPDFSIHLGVEWH